MNTYTNMPEHTKQQSPGRKGKVRTMAVTTWVSIEYIATQIVDAVTEDLRVFRKEANLFLGTTIGLLGLFNWSTGKYCDGNSSDYLSCTRPTVYYYYGAFEIALMVLGVVLVLVWCVNNRQTK